MGEIDETVGCQGFKFATPYRALPSFVNDPLMI
jgi:hypothetical protein